MALDFTILDSDGRPSESVPLGVDTHSELVALGRAIGAGMTETFRDYYADAQLDIDQLETARTQLRQLQAAKISGELDDFLAQFHCLVDRAIYSGSPVHIIAD